jgi:CubicO group peptidase (beta-lactamase class C family)
VKAETEHWANRLAALAVESKVPGASLAFSYGGETHACATGVLNNATGAPVLADSLFQIGSITKVWTATLVMQLVDEGLVRLDEPVTTYLPEFRLADPETTAAITVRHLLSHQAGFEGDVFTDTGRGDDAIATFVDLLADMPQIFPPGDMFSYNNAGYIVLGLLVERLRGTTWEQALVERIAAPLGLARVSPSPYEAILHRVAVGHVGRDENGVETPAPFWAMARSNEPAGSMLAMTARDLAGFARMHLAGGIAANGDVVLSAESAAAMRAPQVSLPRVTGMGSAWGLGWEIDRVGEPALFGHDGNTVGQASFLRIAPDAGTAVALLTNGGDGAGLFHDIVDELLSELAGVRLPERLTPPAQAPSIDAGRYVGVYENSIVEMEFSADAEGRIWLEQRPKEMLLELGEQPSREELIGFSDDSLIMRNEQSGMHIVFAFLSPDDDGHHSYVHFGRALSRQKVSK